MSITSTPPIPAYVQWRDFLPPDEHRALLEWVLTGQDRFREATVKGRGPGAQNRVDPGVRIALNSFDLGELRRPLSLRLIGALPRLIAATGTVGRPPTSLELELAAHGDGAHFVRHLDIPVGQGGQPLATSRGGDRVLSGVLYFHREPKGFSGGCLRLYRFGAEITAGGEANARDFVEIEPLQNSLVIFPSWTEHEVRPVHCPSKRFEDYRLALNCWFCRKP